MQCIPYNKVLMLYSTWTPEIMVKIRCYQETRLLEGLTGAFIVPVLSHCVVLNCLHNQSKCMRVCTLRKGRRVPKTND